MNAKLIETQTKKIFRSQGYNYDFDKLTGFFVRWGDTLNDDGDLRKGLPEIADIEISTICSGVNKSCGFCYKSNNSKGKYMTYETFIAVFNNLPRTITQIAFGIGDINANPDMWKIFEYCRNNGVIPNVTINGAGMNDETFNRLVHYCGAVAVSIYDKELSYDAIKILTNKGLRQVNIHYMLCEETYMKAYEIMNDIKKDKRLVHLNAIVFLSLKPKGRAKNGYTQLSQEKFNDLVKYALDNEISIGFDSCSAQKFLKCIEGTKYENLYNTMVEPCESSLYSSYINVDGMYFPCSFIEKSDWQTGIDVKTSKNFITDIWNSKKNIEFRERVIKCRENHESCPHFKI